MSWRPPTGPRAGASSYGPRYGRSEPAPPGPVTDSTGYGVPFYQNAQDMRRREQYDTLAFASPDEYNQWGGAGQPPRSRPPSSMPAPRRDAYRPSFPSFNPGYPTQVRPFNAGYPGNLPARPFSTNAVASSSKPSSYVPPHLRGQSPSLLNPTSPPSRASRAPSAEKAPQFVITFPVDEYMQLSSPHVPSLEERAASRPPGKLLVLDLNGTLIYRNKSSGNSRTSYPRPYLGNFLDYLLANESDAGNNGWSVFVWSSAQPHNVRGMLESTFDPDQIEGLWDEKGAAMPGVQNAKGRVLGVWARDKMGLSAQQYANKTQTTKDLTKVASHFAAHEAQTGAGFRLQDILLLDDSPRKAVHQPWNQLVLPEYDRAAYQKSRDSIAGEAQGESSDQCDQYLLAIVGILEELNSVSNIPAWVRGGGLRGPDFQTNPSQEDRVDLDGPAAGSLPTLEQLPSHDDFKHWFQDPALVDKWIEKGKQALEARGIRIELGTRFDTSAVRSLSPFSPSAPSRSTSRHQTPGHTVPVERRRGFSPSRPAGADYNETEDEDLARRARSISIESIPTGSARPGEQTQRVTVQGTRGRGNAKSTRIPQNHQTRSFTTTNPNPNVSFNPVSEAFDPSRPVDTWRTLRSADVSRWLADFADRAFLDQQARNLLHQAGDLLKTQGTDEAWDRRMPEEVLRIGGWHNKMTDEEITRQGELRALYQTEQSVMQASANNLPPCEPWLKKGKKRLENMQHQDMRLRPVFTSSNGEPVPIQEIDRIRRAVNIGSNVDEAPRLMNKKERRAKAKEMAEFDVTARMDIRAPPAPPTEGLIDTAPSSFTQVSGQNGDHTFEAPISTSPNARSTRSDPPLTSRSRRSDPNPTLLPGLDDLFDSDSERGVDEDSGSEYIDGEDREGQEDDIPEEPHQLYPRDYPSSSLELPPYSLDGSKKHLLTDDEIARYFARAKISSDRYQAKYLQELRKIENKLRGGLANYSDPNNTHFNDTRRAMRLRGWIIRAEIQRDETNARARERRRVIKEAKERGESTPPPQPRERSGLKRDPELIKRARERKRQTERERAPGRTGKKRPKNKKKNKGANNNNGQTGNGTHQHSNQQGDQAGTRHVSDIKTRGQLAASAVATSSNTQPIGGGPRRQVAPATVARPPKRKAPDSVHSVDFKVQRFD